MPKSRQEIEMRKNTDLNRFYVYTHAKPDGTVFYVGKGTADRDHVFGNRNPYHKNVVAKYGRSNVTISRVAINLSESEALSLEVSTIKEMRTDGVSALTNMTDGGEGSSGYVKTETERLAISARSKAMHADPEYRKAHSARMQEVHRTAEARAAVSRRMLELHKDSDYAERKLASVRAACCNDEFKTAISERMTNLHATQEYKERHSEAMKKCHGTPERREAMSAQSKAMHADPAYQAANRIRMKECHSSPEYKDKMSALLKATMGTDEYRAAASARSIEVSNRPEVKALRSKAMKARFQSDESRAKLSELIKASITPEERKLRAVRVAEYAATPEGKISRARALAVASTSKIEYTMLNPHHYLWAKKVKRVKKRAMSNQAATVARVDQ